MLLRVGLGLGIIVLALIYYQIPTPAPLKARVSTIDPAGQDDSLESKPDKKSVSPNQQKTEVISPLIVPSSPHSSEQVLLAFILSAKTSSTPIPQLLATLLQQPPKVQDHLIQLLAQQIAYTKERNTQRDLAFAQQLTQHLLRHKPSLGADFLLEVSTQDTFDTMHEDFYEQWLTEAGIETLGDYLLKFHDSRHSSPDTALHILSELTQSKETSTLGQLADWISALDTATQSNFKYDATLVLLNTLKPQQVDGLKGLMREHLNDERMSWLVPGYVGQHLIRHTPQAGLQWLSTLPHGQWTQAVIEQAFTVLGQEAPLIGAQALNAGHIKQLTGLPEKHQQNAAYFEAARTHYLKGMSQQNKTIDAIEQYLSQDNQKIYQQYFQNLHNNSPLHQHR